MKFYLAKPTAPKGIADTGYHESARAWLAISKSTSIVALPNSVASPAGYKLLGQGADLATLPIGAAERDLLFGDAKLVAPVRASTLGRAIFQAMTIGADHALADVPNPIEPNRQRKLSVFFDGQPIYQVDFDRNNEYAQPIISRKQSGYRKLRARSVLGARKYLLSQQRNGFSLRDVQEAEFAGDGPGVEPTTQVTEDGTPLQTWTVWDGSGGTLSWSANKIELSSGNSEHRVIGCDTGVSLGDHRVTVEVLAGNSSAITGPSCRLEEPAMTLGEECYCLYRWSGNWYLRRHQQDDPGTWTAIANGSYGAQNYLSTQWIEASGSDITAQFDALSIGPYTDTAVPDTQLFGGATLYNTSDEIDNWILDDFVSEGGSVPTFASLDPTVLRRGLTDGSGNLKAGLTTDAYSSGTPSGADELNASLVDSSGNLRAGLVNPDGDDLKSSIKASS